MKVQTVNSTEDIDKILASVRDSANKALTQFARCKVGSDGLKSLWEMKFNSIGCDPLNSERPLNLIEQLNQTFTYVASCRAAKLLLSFHPTSVPFTLNLGTAPGSDIESTKDGGIAAEVFAAVNTSNNRKLIRDIKKVCLTQARFKYVFFMCPGYGEGRQQKLEKNSGVEVWSVEATV